MYPNLHANNQFWANGYGFFVPTFRQPALMLPSFMWMAPIVYPSLPPPYSFNSGTYSEGNQNYLPPTLNSHVLKHMEASQDEDKKNVNTSDWEQEEKKSLNEYENEWCQPKTPKASTPTNFTVCPMSPSDYAVSKLEPLIGIHRFFELGKYAKK